MPQHVWESLSPLSRRSLIRAAGVGLALPWLDAMRPAFARSRRMVTNRKIVLVNRALGLHAPDLFPQRPGRDYELSPYLKEFAELRDRMTVISGLSHPEVGGGHGSEASFLTAAPRPGTPAFRNTISIDQLLAEQLSGQTRYPYLALASHQGSLSWTRNGVQIPADKDPVAVFRRLFVAGTPAEVRSQEEQLSQGRSILDSIRSETSALERDVGPGDRARLDQYFTAVRDVERRLQNAEAWSKRPKPRVSAPPPEVYPDASDIIGRTAMMFDLMHLALLTDSTRVITFAIDVDGGTPPIPGVGESRHNLSHHGQDARKLAQLRTLELEELKVLRNFVNKLASDREDGNPLLDETTVFFGSNLGNASSHDTRNLPALMFGGGFRHGQYLAFDSGNNTPLANLFVSMLQRFGLETDSFATSTGTLQGLELL